MQTLVLIPYLHTGFPSLINWARSCLIQGVTEISLISISFYIKLHEGGDHDLEKMVHTAM